MKICFASNNQNKLNEIRPLLEPDFVILSLRDIGCFEELPETQPTIEGNALQKAQFVFDKYHTPCFADDTGLETEALSMAPGVYSARYAGEHKNNDDNIDLLLKNLSTANNRNARFRSVIALVGLTMEVQLFEGIVEGIILHERRGTDGFGYDPVFQPSGFTKTFAEMSIAEKNKISHRAIAVNKLIDHLKKQKLT